MGSTQFNEQHYTLPLVQAGPATLANFNTPIEATQNAVNDLYNKLMSMDGKSAVMLYQQTLDGADLGDLVYCTQQGKFKPAKASLKASPGTYGQTLVAEQSIVSGIVVNVNGAHGTILVGGSFTSLAVAKACTQCTTAQPAIGLYYLSATTAGKAVQNPGNILKQPVLQYFGQGKINMCMYYQAQQMHSHRWFSLYKKYWKPGTNIFTYKDDPQLTGIQLGTCTAAIFYKGILQTPAMGSFGIGAGGNIWCKLAAAPEDGDVIVMNHFPMVYGSPVVRSVQSTGASYVSVQNNSGNVCIVVAQPAQGSTVSSSEKAVCSINPDGTYDMAPIISNIVPGPGIATEITSGVAKISVKNNVGVPLQATTVDLQGAMQTVDSAIGIIVTKIPAGRSIKIYMPVNDIETNHTITPWCQTTGTACSMTVAVCYAVLDVKGNQSHIISKDASQQPYTGTISTTTATGALLYKKATMANKLVVSTPGMAVATLTASSQATLVRFGFIVQTA